MTPLNLSWEAKMSRGISKTQRVIIDKLKYRQLLSIEELHKMFPSHRLDSVRRAVKSLERRGLVDYGLDDEDVESVRFVVPKVAPGDQGSTLKLSLPHLL
jgi:hypothetical protein